MKFIGISILYRNVYNIGIVYIGFVRFLHRYKYIELNVICNTSLLLLLQ